MAHRLHKERKVKLTTPIAVTYYNLRIDTALAVRHNVQIWQHIKACPRKAHPANFRLVHLLRAFNHALLLPPAKDTGIHSHS